MKWSKRKAVTKAQGAINSYNEQIQTLTEECNQTLREATTWKQQQDEAYANFARLWINKGSEAEIKAVSSVVPAAKLEDVVSRCAMELAANQERVATIAEDQSYRDHPRLLGSVFPQSLHEIGNRLEAIDQELKPFRTDEFRFALAENLHIKPKATGIRGLWEGLTGKARRKGRALAELRKTFKGMRFAKVVAHYKTLNEKRNGIEAEQNAAMAEEKSLKALVSEFTEKSAMINDYDRYRTQAVIAALTPCLAGLKLEDIIPHIATRLKAPLAQCVALKKKIEYANNLVTYLNREIMDRKKRVLSISGTQAKWQRYPKGSIPAKSKWLEEVPNMKLAGTRKRARWSRQSRDCLSHYDDYDTFGNHMWHSHHHGRSFLAFDVFNHSTSHRMPYEGFTREAIPELAQHREIHHQEGPPKEWLNEHSQKITDDPQVEAEEGAIDMAIETDIPKDANFESEQEEPFGTEFESDSAEWADDAAEAIAEDFDEFEAASSEDAS